MTSLLEIKELSVFSPSKTLVNKVSLTINRGEKLALVGESGSGKSLTAKSLLQLLPNNLRCQGDLRLAETDLLNLTHQQLLDLRGKKIGMIPQEPLTALNPLHKVGKQLAECISCKEPLINKVDLQAKVSTLMHEVSLSDAALLNRYPHELSGGQRQRIMIAMAIANKPDLLIADEPTTALDVTVASEILVLIDKLCSENNMSLLLITHDLNIVRRYAERVCVMKDGAIIETNYCATLFAQPSTTYTKELLQSTLSRDLSEPEDEHILSANNVAVTYGTTSFWRNKSQAKSAISDITLRLHKSETLGIVGESGSGKSTLAKAILRLIEFQGNISIAGTEISQLNKKQLRAFRKHIQVVFQDPFSSLSPRMSISEIITEGLKEFQTLNPTQADQAALAIMLDVGLDESLLHQFPHELSGGQRQRVAIARSLILHPDILVLDEPTSALDHSVQQQIIALLQKLQKKYRTSYVFISHDLAVIKAVSHQLLVLKDGKMVEQGLCLDVLQKPQESYTKSLIEASHL